MNVLVTGGDGFIGGYVVKALESEGHSVRVFDLQGGHDLIAFNPGGLKGINAVINLAGEVGLKTCKDDPILAVRNNVLATCKLLETCRIASFKGMIVHASTWAVTGNLVNPYDVTKLCGENLVNSYHHLFGLNTCVLRFGTTYGKGMSSVGVIPSYIKCLKEGLPLIVEGRGDQIRQFTHASDIASACVLALEKARSGSLYYVVSPEVTSIKVLAESFGGEIVHAPERGWSDCYKVIDCTPITTDLGWVAKVSLSEGIKLMGDGS